MDMNGHCKSSSSIGSLRTISADSRSSFRQRMSIPALCRRMVVDNQWARLGMSVSDIVRPFPEGPI
jgi:hypothetical protein